MFFGGASGRVVRRCAPAILCALTLAAPYGAALALEVPGAELNEGGGLRFGVARAVTNDALGASVTGSMVSSSGRWTIQPASAVYAPMDPPGRVENLVLSQWFGDTRLNWDATPGATEYNVYRAEQLPTDAPPPVFDAYECGEPTTQYDEWQFPAPGELYSYTITSVTVNFESGLGTTSFGMARVKGTPCP